MFRSFRLAQLALCVIAMVPFAAFAGAVSGELRKWHPLTVDFAGPFHQEMDVGPNPFLDYRLQVTFTAPSGKVYSVPGYFDGNGSGGSSGSVWRVRFTPDESGQWRYQASFRTGPQVAISLDPAAGAPISFNGDSATITVADRNPNAAGFLKYGRLESIGRHYLKFRDGGYWLKLGVNNPENLLGYSGFDNTLFAWHSYSNHVADWQSGDPSWDSPDRQGTSDSRGIIGALNYLAGQGLNSIYFMPMNIGADGRDVWPYASPTINRDGATSNDNLHFDLSKLRQWEIVLQHAQRKELFLHFVLGDSTSANKQELDNATLGTERKLFYRELVARFGHHNALQWNISEEFNLVLPLPPETIRQFAQYIQAVDPYDHPITVHPHGNTYATALAPFLAEDWFRVMSVQTWQQPESIESAVEYFRAETTKAGNPIPVMIDEAIGMNQITADEYRKRTMWDALLSGGGFEMFKSFGDSELDDFRVYGAYYGYARIARRFVEDNLPFWEMIPADGLVSGENSLYGGAEVFAKEGEIYAIYLPSASPSPMVSLNTPGSFQVRWFDPRAGQFQGASFVAEGSAPFSLGAPPTQSSEDWVALIEAVGAGNEAPVAQSQSFSTQENVTTPIVLSYSDADGPGPYSFTITSQPRSGTLSTVTSSGAVSYTPNAGFVGNDSFTWRVHDGLADSNQATVSLNVTGQTTLLSETFDGANSATLGNGWVELESTGNTVGRQSNRLMFVSAADAVNRPMVTRSFQRVSSGELIWDFQFDWTRTGSEGTYRVFMQLGDSTLMSSNSWDAGVGVNLMWGQLSQHQQLAYRVNGTQSVLAQISGPTNIRAVVHLDQARYDLFVNGALVRASIPLDKATALDTVRFFTDSVQASNFAGRSFDSVLVAMGGGSPPSNEVPVALGQSVTVSRGTAVNITLGFSDDDGPGPYTFTVLQAPANGVLTSNNGDALVTYTPNAGYAGPDSFSFRVSDGLANSNTATVSLEVIGETILASDTFDGPDSTTVGGGWVELQGSGGDVSRQNNRMVFTSTADATNRPMMTRSFQRTATGELVWDFRFDWKRTGSEGTYRVFMQLGDSTLMNSNSWDAGVGVNLMWGRVTQQEQLAYRVGGSTTALAQISGPTDIRVIVHLDQGTYDVLVNGVSVKSVIPLDNAVALDTVRFFTDSVNESNFSGRAFDTVRLTAISDGPGNEPAVVQDQSVDVPHDSTVNIALGFSDTDGPGPYTVAVPKAPANGVLGSDDGDEHVAYTPRAGYVGPDSFTFQVHDGLATSSAATVNLNVSGQTTLLSETFDGANSATLGNGWVELESASNTVGRQSNRLMFVSAADAVNRPMVARSFQRASSGTLIWDFQFDWTRTGSEGTYRVFMQLGDSTLMSSNSWDAGVGVNLMWGQLSQHEQLAYRVSGNESPLTQIRGPTSIRVIVHLDQGTYDVLVNGALVDSVIPLDQAAALDTVRFFVDGVNDSNFSGRAFDTVRLTVN